MSVRDCFLDQWKQKQERKYLFLLRSPENLFCCVFFLPLAIIFSLLTWESNDEFILGVKQVGRTRFVPFIGDENRFETSSLVLVGDKLRLIDGDGTSEWWSSTDDELEWIRVALDNGSFKSRDDAAAAARKNGFERAAAIAAWFGSTTKKK